MDQTSRHSISQGPMKLVAPSDSKGERGVTEIRALVVSVEAPGSQLFLTICRFWSELDSGPERGLRGGLPPAVRPGHLSFQEIQTWRLQTAADL